MIFVYNRRLVAVLILLCIASSTYVSAQVRGKKTCSYDPYGIKNKMARPQFYRGYQNNWYASPYGGGYWGPGSVNATQLNPNYQGYPL